MKKSLLLMLPLLVWTSSVFAALQANEESYLLQKVEQAAPLVGEQMPLGGPYLTREQVNIIREWILAGAPPPS